MDKYKKFIKRLVLNYAVGSIIAVFGVSGTLLFTTLSIIPKEKFILISIIISSFISMFLFEGYFFNKHIGPIRDVFKTTVRNEESIQKAVKQLNRFPVLTVKRIMLPHFLGLSIPASSMALYFIHNGQLTFPIVYVLFGFLAAFLVACMHALIEFYLTMLACQPILLDLKSKLQENKDYLFIENVIVPIKYKFQLTVALIGILPILIFLMAAQVKLIDISGMEMMLYWKWAAIVLCFTIFYSALTATFMSKDIERPIAQLQSLMEKARNQNYDYIKSNIYTDEFSKVFSGFNYMIQAIKEREEDNKQLLESFMAALSITLDARDPYTSGHSMRVASYSYEIGRDIGLPKEELDLLYRTALLHDIGKIGVPDHVLLKAGTLTEDEFSYIKAHPIIGENILKQVQPASKVVGMLPGVRSHHERIDGKGYPDGLTGDNIPYFGRIIAVADAFDAMTSDRPYRKGMSIEKALIILQDGKGTQWDERIVDEFVLIVGKKQKLVV